MSNEWRNLAEFTAPSETGGERDVVRRLLVLLEPLGPDPGRDGPARDRRRRDSDEPPWSTATTTTRSCSST